LCDQCRILEPTPKAERTRAAILAAAEEHFARRGFVATRLEDVAADVGLKRATLFYHFRDKQSLYDAVVAAAFGPLAARLEEAFSAPISISARVQRGVEAWVDTMVERPTLARIILRHAAEAEEHPTGIFPGAEALLRAGWALFEQGRKTGELKPVHEDPFHAASAVLGATVFFVIGFSALLPDANFKPLAPKQVALHKKNALRTLHLLLGIRPSRGGNTKQRRAAK
jgi:TetR/AcrR family transcriptional regulator